MSKTKEKRIELHEKLCNILGTRRVYFQPPEGTKLEYPCIVYKRDPSDTRYADNGSYRFTQGYSVTYIDAKPDNNIVEKIIDSFSMCRYTRHYSADHLNHDVLILYY